VFEVHMSEDVFEADVRLGTGQHQALDQIAEMRAHSGYAAGQQ
jgi:hypothetical protein